MSKSNNSISKKLKAAKIGDWLNRYKLFVFVVVFALVGAVVFFVSQAATPSASTEPENSTVTVPTVKGTDATASGGGYVQFKAATAGGGSSSWAGPSNTGYKSAPDYPGSLTTCTGPIQSNTTYRFCYFPGGLSVGNSSSHPVNVTFYGCRFTSNATTDANVAIYGDNITFDYSTFEPSAVSAWPLSYNQGYQYGIDQRYNGNFTVDHSDIWGFGNGIQFGYSTQADPVVVKNSWFHNARDNTPTFTDHTDAILDNQGGATSTYMVFDHNTIVSEGITQGLALQTDPSNNYAGYDHITITNNYFSGFGYTVAIGEDHPSSNITFTGNTFGTDIQPDYGPLYSVVDWSASAGNLWRNNKLHVASNSYYTPSSDEGKYWLPTSSSSGGFSTSDWAQ